MWKRGNSYGALPGSGPRNSEHMEFKGKQEESVEEGQDKKKQQLTATNQLILDLVG